jgi:hypothetical protein
VGVFVAEVGGIGVGRTEEVGTLTTGRVDTGDVANGVIGTGEVSTGAVGVGVVTGVALDIGTIGDFVAMLLLVEGDTATSETRAAAGT